MGESKKDALRVNFDRKSFKKGEVVVPWHSGTLGSNYGVPNMAFIKSGKVEK